MTILSGVHAKVLTAVLAIQSALYYALPSTEYVPTMKPLEQMQEHIEDWRLVSQSHPEQEVQDLVDHVRYPVLSGDLDTRAT